MNVSSLESHMSRELNDPITISICNLVHEEKRKELHSSESHMRRELSDPITISRFNLVHEEKRKNFTHSNRR
ncbi:hypothetical protein KEM48_009899 [Puccinia striiformis f. sp. tritici PST-130]|nr:hypothetical protein H4Q26_006735 [Puccinia striiformis f. sp. tritici PST-130]KAI9627274.1 hypothetical protein KEM48_009899 [Puccinia striiformis f. sp. tritici PST-130]